MKTKRMFLLIGVAALSFTAPGASAAMRGSPMMARSGMARPAMTRPAPRFAPRTMTAQNRFFNDRFHHFNRFNRFHHFNNRFNNRTFVFIDSFGFPFFYPYPHPYYGYYPYAYGYYGYNAYGYGGANRVVEVQRRLASAGYYHGRIDGIMGPRTRRAIWAFERDHNTPV